MPKKIISLDELSRFKSNLDNELESKANVDGNYPTLTAGLADNLTPYSEDSGAEQENPFISNGTGTNNNTEIVTVGDYGLLQEKQGNSVVVNQLLRPLSSDYWAQSNTNVTFNNGVATFTASAQNGNIRNGGSYPVNFTDNHKYLVVANIKTTSATTAIRVYANGGYGSEYSVATTSKQNIFVVFVGVSAEQKTIQIRDTRESGWDEITVYSVICVDLTQMFNGDIPQDLLDNPDHFSWYYNGSLAYNTGSLENSNGVKLVSTGRNIWDEEWELGTLDWSSGQPSNSSEYIRAKNYISIIPNTSYYAYVGSKGIVLYEYDENHNIINRIGSYSSDFQFNVSPNAKYIRFRTRNETTIYPNDITISLYYEEVGEGYDKYYPYEQPYVVDTGSEVLRKAGSVCDYKEPNGTIHRLVGVVDLGTLTFYSSNASGVFGVTDFVTIKGAKSVASGTIANLKCALYIADTSANVAVNNINKTIGINPSGVLVICDTSLANKTGEEIATAMSGVYLYYELATPTTEQGTPFAENLPINDYGMLYWLDSSDNLVGIPQGAKIFFPTNYKGFVDDVYMRTNGDASDLVIQSELSASETQRDTIDTQLLNAIGGTLRQLLASSQSIDFNNTNFIDLGNYTWNYDSTHNYFWTDQLASIIKKPLNDQTKANMICSLYKTDTFLNVYNQTENMTIGIHHSTGVINIRNTTYTDATTFTNATKGVLLAYEKA